MRIFLISLICITFVGSALAVPHAANFYVSLEGNDNWSGTLSEPSSDGSDGPFRSLTRARDEVRKKSDKMRSDIVVMIKEGTYVTDRTIVFTHDDSGKNGYNIIYRNFPDEYPVFSSGKKITRWKRFKDTEGLFPKQISDRVWVADIPQGHGVFYTLFKSDKRLPRARSTGFTPVLGPKDPKRSRDSMHYPAGTVLKNWSNISDVEIVIRPFCLWTMNILPLSRVDEKNKIAYTSLTGSYPLTTERHNRFGPESVWVENVPEALDEPGEWLVNSVERKIYYLPEFGRPEDSIVFPSLQEYFRIEGDEKTKQPVKNIVFDGLTFMHGERDTWSETDKGLQHDWEMYDKGNALLRFRWAQSCKVKNCLFTNSGGTGIRLDLYCQNIEISGNEISHLGGTGILVAGYGPGTVDVNKNNKIINNHINHIGRIYWHNPAILIWQSGGNRIANNVIGHTPYNAFVLGGVMPRIFSPEWGWGDTRELAGTINWAQCGFKPGEYTWKEILPFIHTRDNVFEYNEVHNSMEVLGDGNAVYIRMCPPGNIIRNNYFHHHLGEHSAGVIRADDDQWGCTFENNILCHFTVGGIVIKRENLIKNNYMINLMSIDLDTEKQGGVEDRNGYIKLIPGSSASAESGAPAIDGSIVHNNIMLHLAKSKPRFYFDTSHWPKKRVSISQLDVDNNILYWKNHPEEMQEILSELQNMKVDINSLATDPEFMGFKRAGFKLKKDSPAYKLGINQIDVSEVGIMDEFPERLRKRI